ncbi:hypothetical protein MRS44_014030 [Fusarium solani]|nr:hypothetical protein MRS44_017713 [Fusarium solani]KAJ3453515.1 hypothetical protein MRS44_017762 [Fusarium solani]KAJ3455430.1 hypothetical protein MRS44_014030 [Fusarium solani]
MQHKHPESAVSRRVVAQNPAKGDVCLVRRHWRLALGAYLTMVLAGTMAYATFAGVKPFDLAKRSWGGFDERPTTAKCYQQERTAMILSFLLGSFGVDQFYAHHWPLAVFKLLTLGGGGIWWLVDVILWMVGGVYGTPGCPGGSKHGWQY